MPQRKQRKQRELCTAIAAATLAILALSGCVSTANENQASLDPNSTFDPNSADGPHAAANRAIAPTTITAGQHGTQIVSLDLGNSTLGQYSAPVRGTAVLPAPTNPAATQPLIIINHLRAAGCADESFAYPCANSTERRLDEGMTYLGEHLAAAGYAVLIPDLAPVWIGPDITQPYNQNQLWQQVTTQLVAALTDPHNQELKKHGVAHLDTARIDTSSIGLILHSRSSNLTEPAQAAFGAANIKAVLTYGAAYDTYDSAEFSPAPADIPHFAISGDMDADVGASSNLWLGRYLSTSRSAPAISANIPGFGHMSINRTLSAAGVDDRIGCDGASSCPDAHSHETLLATAAGDWFNWALRGQTTQLPVTSHSAASSELYGHPVRWLLTSNTTANRVWIAAEQITPTNPAESPSCVHSDPMMPGSAANSCPEPETGITQISPATPVVILGEANVTTKPTAADAIALHLAPHGSVQLPATAAALEITVTYSDGSIWQHSLTQQHPALQNRASEHDNGQYLLGTVRLNTPAEHRGKEITAIALNAPQRSVEIAGMELLW